MSHMGNSKKQTMLELGMSVTGIQVLYKGSAVHILVQIRN